MDEFSEFSAQIMCCFKVFRYGFSEAILVFFNRFKSDFLLVWSL